MNKFFVFISGVVVGIAASFLMKPNAITPKIVHISPEDAQVEKPIQNLEMRTTLKNSKQTKMQFETLDLSNKNVVLNSQTGAIEKKTSKIEITLGETDVAQLESQWTDLPHQAEVRREVRGWRVTMLQSNTVLFNSGLREGNLITHDFLHTLAETENDANLAKRVANILNHISIR